MVEKPFALHSSSGLVILKFRLLDHLVDDSERLGCLSYLDVGPFEHSDVHIKKSCGMMSRRLLKRLYESVQSTSSALNSVQRSGSEVQEGAGGASVLRKRKCVEPCGEYLARDGLCLFLGQACKGAERGRAAVRAAPSLGRGVDELLSAILLAFFVKCLSSRMCVDVIRVFDGDVGTAFVNSVLVSGGFYPGLDDDNGL